MSVEADVAKPAIALIQKVCGVVVGSKDLKPCRDLCKQLAVYNDQPTSTEKDSLPVRGVVLTTPHTDSLLAVRSSATSTPRET